MIEEDIDLVLANRGLLGRLFRRFFRVIERSWQLYPLGLLFGLGLRSASADPLDARARSDPNDKRSGTFAMIYPN